MWVGGMVGFFLDVTLPGTEEERGILKWREIHNNQTDEANNEMTSIHTYDIPFLTSYLQKYPFVRYIPFLPYHGQTNDVEDPRNRDSTKMDDIQGENDSDLLANGGKETTM
jgi:nucleobase transporter 1/2